MKVTNINDYTNGWFIGDFLPSLIKSSDYEVAVKWFNSGDSEPIHKQVKATEVTVVISGKIKLGERLFEKGDIILIPPGEFAGFESITDSALVCVKSPSLPDDKVLFTK